jgi:hypothetical protein
MAVVNVGAEVKPPAPVARRAVNEVLMRGAYHGSRRVG